MNIHLVFESIPGMCVSSLGKYIANDIKLSLEVIMRENWK